jgi:hypothetical protein
VVDNVRMVTNRIPLLNNQWGVNAQDDVATTATAINNGADQTNRPLSNIDSM